MSEALCITLAFLKDEPEGKYLEELDEEALPQVSDAVLVMVQFETALHGFVGRYYRNLHMIGYDHVWVTEELVAEIAEAGEDVENDEHEESEGETV